VDDLTGYPRPNVAVDVAVLTTLESPDPRSEPGRLAVLVQQRTATPTGRVLPGRFLRPGETIAECVRTALRVKAGLDVDVRPRLLRVFDAPRRDPRAWTLSLAHYVALPRMRLRTPTGDLVAIGRDGELEDGSRLLFDHNEIVGEAARRMRERYELRPDPYALLEDPFTLAELKTVHEAVLGEHLHRDTFRRRMEEQLRPWPDEAHQELRRDRGRPARLWFGLATEPIADRRRRTGQSDRPHQRLRLPRLGES
jgi:ADP-ribose pyrophosphatase YjhB (NUDIX family)